MAKLFSTLVNDKNGVCRRYIVDLDNNKMWLNYDYEFMQYGYRSSIQYWFVILPILYFIGLVFFHGRPTWLWGVKEIENPRLTRFYEERDRRRERMFGK